MPVKQQTKVTGRVMSLPVHDKVKPRVLTRPALLTGSTMTNCTRGHRRLKKKEKRKKEEKKKKKEKKDSNWISKSSCAHRAI